MTNKFGLFDTDVESIVSVLRKYPQVESAYIFGSRAKGSFKNGSDVDVALKGDALDLDTLAKISYWLNEETSMPYKFDLLIYQSINDPALKEHIDRVGIEFYKT